MKAEINKFVARLRGEHEKKASAMKVSPMSLHMVFTRRRAKPGFAYVMGNGYVPTAKVDFAGHGRLRLG